MPQWVKGALEVQQPRNGVVFCRTADSYRLTSAPITHHILRPGNKVNELGLETAFPPASRGLGFTEDPTAISNQWAHLHDGELELAGEEVARLTVDVHKTSRGAMARKAGAMVGTSCTREMRHEDICRQSEGEGLSIHRRNMHSHAL